MAYYDVEGCAELGSSSDTTSLTRIARPGLSFDGFRLRSQRLEQGTNAVVGCELNSHTRDPFRIYVVGLPHHKSLLPQILTSAGFIKPQPSVTSQRLRLARVALTQTNFPGYRTSRGTGRSSNSSTGFHFS